MIDPMTTETRGVPIATITAFFDHRAEADRAVERLRGAGLGDASIRLTEGAQTGSEDVAEDSSDSRGFFAALGDFFFPAEDRHAYAEGLARGGFLVTASDLGGEMYDRALVILDDEGAVDLSEREASWRSEGWAGYDLSGEPKLTGGRSVNYQRDGASDFVDAMTPDFKAGRTTNMERSAGTERSGADTVAEAYAHPIADEMSDTAQRLVPGVTSGAAALQGANPDVLSVVQERVRVDKRDASHGRVRVRSYVVEEPFSETVELRDAHVEIDRRAVDRALTGTDDPFLDRVIEAEEFREEAVISKEARVVEEIALRKTEGKRSEVVTDTIRRTEVEIEDERT